MLYARRPKVLTYEWILGSLRSGGHALRRMTQAEVYFIKINEFVKVGYAFNARDRLSHVSVASPYEPIMLGTIPGDREVEGVLHRHFKECRHRGEWFRHVGIVHGSIGDLLAAAGDWQFEALREAMDASSPVGIPVGDAGAGEAL